MPNIKLLVEDEVEYNDWTYKLTIKERPRTVHHRFRDYPKRRVGKLELKSDQDKSEYPKHLEHKWVRTLEFEEKKKPLLRRNYWEDLNPDMTLKDQADELIYLMQKAWDEYDVKTLDEL